jgi:hypothetical protein
MANPVWTVDIHPLNGGVASSSAVPFSDMMFNYVLNAPGAFEASLPMEVASATKVNLEPGQKEIRVLRNGTLVWGGYLWAVFVDARGRRVRVQGEGYHSRLRRRIVNADLIYREETPDNQEVIAWKLIDHAQTQVVSGTSGTMGMTRGAHVGTALARSRDYCRVDHANIGDAIEELTNADDGFDFEFTPTPTSSTNKVFLTYAPLKGADVSGTVVFTGSNAMNISGDIDAREVANDIFAEGTSGCGMPEFEATGGASLTNFGVMQDVLQTDVDHLPSVKSLAREAIRQRKQARWTLTVEYNDQLGPAWGSFVVGDLVQVNTAKGFLTINQKFRCISYEVHVNGPRNTFIRTDLDSVII